MKICPVCGARAFDDAQICYGCLYRFEEEGECFEESQIQDMLSDDSADDSLKIEMFASENAAGEEAKKGNLFSEASEQVAFPVPEFLIRFKPVASTAGDVTWSCSVEV